jgi:cytochrome c oxidase assembly factor CtaG
MAGAAVTRSLLPVIEPERRRGVHGASAGPSASLAYVYRLGLGATLPPLHPAALITQARPDLLASALLLASAILYGAGVLRMRRRGDRWPLGRTVCFAMGLATLAIALLSGLAAYDTTLLSAHMVQHMVLSMVAPIFLALGAPVTLALRTLQLGPRKVLLAVVHSRYVRFLCLPVVSFGLFVANPFVLYFSGLYRVSLEHEWVHQWVHLHLLVVGCLFFWPLLGIDPLPGRMPYPLRALLMVVSTPFHTVLGLTVMQSANLIGGEWYPSLRLDWADPFADQRVAGGILWAGGEFVAVGMLGALLYQWMRHSEREARRIDRALDRAEAEEAARAEAELAARTEAAELAAPSGAARTGAARTGAARTGAARTGAAGSGPAPVGTTPDGG